MSIIKESGWHENDVQLRVNSKSVLGNGVMTKGYYLVIRDKTTCGCIIPIHERAMKALVIEGIIKLTGYSNAQRSYRAYAISKRCLRRFFGADREA